MPQKVRIYHPGLDRTVEVFEPVARHLYRSGWQPAEPQPPPRRTTTTSAKKKSSRAAGNTDKE